MSYKQKRVRNGLLVGLAAGLAATFVMTQFQNGSQKLAKSMDKEKENEHGKKKEEPDATVKVATNISRSVFRHELDDDEKKTFGPVVHYAFGGLMGGLYGMAAELHPDVTRGLGMFFGAALFVAADQIAVPALGLSKSPVETPIATHAQELASHLVYGAALDALRRVGSSVID